MNKQDRAKKILIIIVAFMMLTSIIAPLVAAMDGFK